LTAAAATRSGYPRFVPGNYVQQEHTDRLLYKPDTEEYYQRFEQPISSEFEFEVKSVDSIESLEEKLAHDVAYFSEFFWDIGLEEKQIEFSNNCLTKRHSVARFSRQSGKSTIIAILVVHQLVFGKHAYIHCFAPTENQVLRVIYARVRELFKAQPWLLKQIADWNKKGFIQMKNGNYFQAQTAAKDSNLRGGSPSIIIADESQDIDDETWFAGVMPSGGGQSKESLQASSEQ